MIIRLAKLGDEKNMIDYFNHQVLYGDWEYTGANKPKDSKKINEMRKMFLNKKPDRYYFIAINDGKIIGSVNISFKSSGRLRHRANIGWNIHCDYRGKGFATKLVKTILLFAKKKGFKKIQAEIAIKNKASIKLAKRAGFKIEGTIKKGMLLDNGKYIDTYIVGKTL